MGGRERERAGESTCSVVGGGFRVVRARLRQRKKGEGRMDGIGPVKGLSRYCGQGRKVGKRYRESFDRRSNGSISLDAGLLCWMLV